MRRPSLLAAAIAIALAACESFTEVIGPTPFGATLSGADVRPTSVTTEGKGTLTASLLPYDVALAYTLGWSDLGSAVTAAHIHGPAASTVTAGILVDLAAVPGATFDIPGALATGEIDLTVAVTPTVSGDSLVKLLHAGRLYIDVHTINQPNGEIRGQVVRR